MVDKTVYSADSNKASNENQSQDKRAVKVGPQKHNGRVKKKIFDIGFSFGVGPENESQKQETRKLVSYSQRKNTRRK